MDEHSQPTPKRPADEVLRAYSPRPAVRRLNRAALAAIFLVVGLLFAGRLIVGLFNRYAEQIRDEERQRAQLRAPDDAVERGIVGKLPTDYTFTIQPPAPPEPEPPKVEERPQEPPPIDPELLKQLEALRREQETAINSPIQFANVNAIGSALPNNDNTALQPSPNANTGFSLTEVERQRPYDAQHREFFRDAGDVQTHVRSPFLPPRSPYEIKAGTIIPAALVTPINSDLPGDVIGQVTVNLYDTITGRHLLIPQGSRLIGRYNSEVLNGHDRALIAWQRLILPNGYSIVLDVMPGTDAAGVAGMSDRVDWHTAQLLGATFLSTLIALGGNLAADIDPSRRELSTVAETVAQDASRIGQRVIDRQLDRKPTIIIREGMPFNVLVNKDIELAPYEPVITRR